MCFLDLAQGDLMISVTCSVHAQWGLNLVNMRVSGICGSLLSISGTSFMSTRSLHYLNYYYSEHKRVQIVFNKIYVYHTCQDWLQFHEWSLSNPTEHNPHHHRATIRLCNILLTIWIHSLTQRLQHENYYLPKRTETKFIRPDNKKTVYHNLVTMFSDLDALVFIMYSCWLISMKPHGMQCCTVCSLIDWVTVVWNWDLIWCNVLFYWAVNISGLNLSFIPYELQQFSHASYLFEIHIFLVLLKKNLELLTDFSQFIIMQLMLNPVCVLWLLQLHYFTYYIAHRWVGWNHPVYCCL